LILKYIRIFKAPTLLEKILKHNNAGGLILLFFRIQHKATVIKTVYYCLKIDKLNTEMCESPEIDLLLHYQCISNKGAKATHWMKQYSIQQMMLKQVDIP
jgi:hypothetical protein